MVRDGKRRQEPIRGEKRLQEVVGGGRRRVVKRKRCGANVKKSMGVKSHMLYLFTPLTNK